jgi:hypothetical protein
VPGLVPRLDGKRKPRTICQLIPMEEAEPLLSTSCKDRANLRTTSSTSSVHCFSLNQKLWHLRRRPTHDAVDGGSMS